MFVSTKKIFIQKLFQCSPNEKIGFIVISDSNLTSLQKLADLTLQKFLLRTVFIKLPLLLI